MENNKLGTYRLSARKDKHIKRKFFHVIPGLIGVGVYLSGIVTIQKMGYFCLVLAVCFFILDIFRLNNQRFNEVVCRLVKPFMRDNEVNGVSGAPFYALGVGLSCVLFKENIAFLSILFLIFGDPLAAFVGSIYGREYYLPNKSVEGSLACFLVCYGTCFFYLKALGVVGIDAVTFSLFAGIIGAVSELVSTIKIDDNLTIPVISGLGISLLNSLIPLL